MSNNAFWCTILGSVLTFVLLLAVSLMALDVYRDCQYMKAGYTRQMLPGHSWPEWVKAEPAPRTPPAAYNYNDIAVPIAMPLCGKMETAK